MKISSEPVVDNAMRLWKQSEFELVGFNILHAVESAPEMTPIEQVVFFRLKDRALWGPIKIFPQHRIGKYRVDFLVVLDFGSEEKIVIECDGHDFHERTREQAQKDKSRDRELQKMGYKVFRFTGSEIWRTTGECVLEALEIQESR